MQRRSSWRSMSFCICGLRYGRSRCCGRFGWSHDDAAGHTHYRRALRNIGHDEGVRRDLCAAADLDLTHQRRAGADIDLVAKDRSALTSHRGGTDCYAMGDVAVSADDCLRVDVNSPDVARCRGRRRSWPGDRDTSPSPPRRTCRRKSKLSSGNTNQDERGCRVEPVPKAIYSDRPDRRVQPKLPSHVALKICNVQISSENLDMLYVRRLPARRESESRYSNLISPRGIVSNARSVRGFGQRSMLNNVEGCHFRSHVLASNPRH